jgi:uncharacterized UPF0146 family protein
VLEAPPPLQAEIDDMLRPRWAVYEGAALLYALRLPEELHAAAAEIAGHVGADLALRLRGDEAPALPRGADVVLGDKDGAWFLWRSRS